jgi:hypothetical protein
LLLSGLQLQRHGINLLHARLHCCPLLLGCLQLIHISMLFAAVLVTYRCFACGSSIHASSSG